VQVVKRMLFRGLDYLPPADPSFLDLVRAVLACDRAAHPTDRNGLRAGLIRHALRRGIGVGESDLDTPADAIAAALGEIDIDSVLNSDWHAMRLIEQHRQRFAIPDGAPFDVLPRAMVRKKIMRSRGGPSWRSELLLKFHWRQTEPACGVDHLPQQRWVRSGCTVAIDAESRRVCAYLSIDPTPQTAARDAMVKALAESGALASLPGRSARPRDPIAWSVSAGAYELHATARALHLAPGSHR
jgi:hypothetical protein